jgi:hypothetical protein
MSHTVRSSSSEHQLEIVAVRMSGIREWLLMPNTIRVARKMSEAMATEKQNITISVSPETVQKARMLAARRSTSISRLLAEQMEILVAADEAYTRSEPSALALLEEGFHLDGLITTSRDELHER